MKPLIAQLVAALGLASARFDNDDQAIEACLGEVRSRRDAASTTEATHRTALDAMTAQRDAEKARADAAEAKIRGLEQAEQARHDAAERTELEALAKGLGVDPALHTDSKALRRAIASKHLGSEVKADASDDYVRALVDLARAGASRDDGRTEGRAAWSPVPAPVPIPGGGGSPRQPAAPPPARADSRPSGRRSLFDVARQRSDSARAGGDA